MPYLLLVFSAAASGLIYSGVLHFLPRYLQGSQALRLFVGGAEASAGNLAAAAALMCGAAGQWTAGRLAKAQILPIQLAIVYASNAPLLIWMAYADGTSRIIAAGIWAFFHFMNQPLYNALLAEFMSVRRRSFGFGFSNMMGFGVGAVGPYLIARYDATPHGFTDGYLLMAVVALVAGTAPLVVLSAGIATRETESASWKIRSLTAFQVPIGLRKPVRHASHVRHHNETLVVCCKLSNGQVGWGEGLPRPYVTGESIESVWRHLEQTSFGSLADEFQDAREASDMFDQFVLASVDAPPGVTPRECFGNAVRCGLEVAILDAACQADDQSVGDWIASLPEAAALIKKRNEVFYSTVITSMTARKQWLSAWKMKLFGFDQVKVKVGAKGSTTSGCRRGSPRSCRRSTKGPSASPSTWSTRRTAGCDTTCESTCWSSPIAAPAY